jgi:cell shape-determining protein MreD
MVPKNIVRFLLLLIFQVLVLNHIHFYGFLNPYVYILFIFLLPFETPGWLLLTLSFLCGMVVDLFSGTLGLHAAASVFTGFVKPGIIKLVGEKPEYDSTTQPTLKEMGFKWFLAYSSTMTFLHHLVLNFIDVFSFREFWQTFLRILLSSVFTLIFILIIQYIFTSRKEKH